MFFRKNLFGALLATGLAIACPAAYAKAADGGTSCGYISSEAGVVPTSKDIYRAAINQIDGLSPTIARHQYKLDAGKHILLIGDRIESNALNNAQLIQISKMKRRSKRAGYFETPPTEGDFKTLVLDVQPGRYYRLGVRLLRDKLDTQSIRDNAYWEPVVWEESAQACSGAAIQSNDLVATTAFTALQAGPAAGQARYELGAVVDVRQASANGAVLLAVTPGGAADRMGLQAGDRLQAINGHRLDDTPKPASALERALQEGEGTLQIEAMRNGKPLLLSGRADLAVAGHQGGAQSCGYVTDGEGVVPRSAGIFNAEITQIEGRSTPLSPANRHRVDSGKRVLVVREFIDPNYLNSAQLNQIAKMKKFAFARAYKSFVVDVKPGMSYRIGARLLKDKLDTQSIRDNAYWEPAVWKEVVEACP